MSYIANRDIPVGSALNRLGSLSDVNINNPANGDGLIYDSTSGKWLNAKGLKKLWENPNPTADFAAQTITLNSDDYDYLVVFYKCINTLNNMDSCMILKGFSAYLQWLNRSNNYPYGAYRTLERTDDIHYAVYDCTFIGNNSTGTGNARLVPYAIYGGKFAGNNAYPSGNAESLVSLSDVNINNPQNGDTIVYNSTTGKWENSDRLSALEDKVDQTDGVIAYANGSKTYSNLLRELATQLNFSKVTYNTKLIYHYSESVFDVCSLRETDGSTYIQFVLSNATSAGTRCELYHMNKGTGDYICRMSTGAGYQELGGNAVPNGRSLEIIY